jgi:hypothetical protein
VSVRDARIGLIFAGWLLQDGLFGRSVSAGLSSEAGFRDVNPIAVQSRNADHSSRSRLLVFLVRLRSGLVEETSLAAAALGSRRSFLPPSRLLAAEERPRRVEACFWSSSVS